MTGRDLKKWRTKRGLSQQALAELAGAALDRGYGSQAVSAWENGRRPIPEHTAAFFERLMDEDGFEPAAAPPPNTTEDSAPPPPDGTPSPIPVMPTGNYSEACEELWGMIAMGFSLTGMALNRPKLQVDGAILDADKKALGEAWGKAAETNPTMQRWLNSLSAPTVWLQVAYVTGQTAGKMYVNHLTPAATATAAHGAPVSEGGGNGYESGVTLVAEEPPGV